MIINQAKIILDYFMRRNKISGAYKVGTYSDLAYMAQINTINRHVKKEGVQTYSYDADEISSIQEVSTTEIGSGRFSKPSDFMYLMDIEHTYVENAESKKASANMLRQNEFNNALKDSIVFPTNEYPIAKWVSDGWVVRPDAITSVDVTYIKIPAKPEWAYTLDGSGREVFDETNSVDFELPESMIHELILEMLQIVGINIREGEIVQYANTLKRDE